MNPRRFKFGAPCRATMAGFGTVTGETAVRLTMIQFVGGILAIALSSWGAMALVTSGIRDDVGAIRQSLQGLQTSDKEGAVRLRETETKLVEQIGGLRTELANYNGKLDATNRSLELTSKALSTLAGQLTDRPKATRQPSKLV